MYRLLDLYSGAGGCSMGYHQAGFDVVGVDHKPMPRYPFPFLCMDALECLERLIARERLQWSDGNWYALEDFDAIHASPPCQRFSRMSILWNRDHPDLITPTRNLLMRIGKPYIIENVQGAPLKKPVVLCGSSFGLRVRRHRGFETSFPILLSPPCSHDWQDSTPCFRIKNHGEQIRGIVYVFGNGSGKGLLESWSREMGISWMRKAELAQAIPPAYTRWLGTYLIQHLDAVRPAGCWREEREHELRDTRPMGKDRRAQEANRPPPGV